MTTMHENILPLSTWAEPERERRQRYVSAEHAIRRYLEARAGLSGERGIDYEQLLDRVQTSRRPDNPYNESIDEMHTIERILEPIRRRVGEEQWRVWTVIRVRQQNYRQVSGLSKSHAQRVVRHVDGLFEEALAREGKIVQNAVGCM